MFTMVADLCNVGSGAENRIVVHFYPSPSYCQYAIVCRFGAVNYVSKEQTSLRMYEAVMHDHLGLKFTPVGITAG